MRVTLRKPSRYIDRILYTFLQIDVILLTIFMTEGCAVVDPYGSRVDVYNEEAEASRSRLLLLNIIRSAQGQPLQWSSLSQVQGSASAGASLGASLPIIGRLPASGSLVYTLSPMISGSGGPTFTVPVLDIKEFQNGIMTPITPGIVKAFIDEGYPLEAILPLVLSAIEFSRPGVAYRIENEASGAETAKKQSAAFERFAVVVRQLIDKGLTVEALDAPVGVLLLRKDVQNPKTVSDAIAGGLEIREFHLGSGPTDRDLSPEDLRYLRDQKQTNYFRTFKIAQGARFCFDELRYYQQTHSDAIVLQPLRVANKELPFFAEGLEERPGSALTIPADLVCGYRGPRVAKRDRLDFVLRSTEGAVVYLGKLARLQLGLGGNAPQLPTMVDRDPRGARRSELFTVKRGTLPGRSIATTAGGDTYSVPVTGEDSNLSSRMLTLLGEMVTLNSSAKDLPSPNVISVIAP